MRIAVISSNGKTISQHFGMAPYYVVVTVEGGQVVARETRPKAGHHTASADSADTPAGVSGRADIHETMAHPIADCGVLIAGGMGQPAFESLRTMGIKPVLTDLTDIDEACIRLARGDLPNLVDRIHEGHHHHMGSTS